MLAHGFSPFLAGYAKRTSANEVVVQVCSTRMENIQRFAEDFMDRFGICMAQDAAIEHIPIDPDRSTAELRKFRVCRTGFDESGTAVSDECDELTSELSDAGG